MKQETEKLIKPVAAYIEKYRNDKTMTSTRIAWDIIQQMEEAKVIAVQPDVIKSVCYLDGKTIPVNFKVSKMKPKPFIDE